MITAIAVILILAYLVNVIYVLKKGSPALGQVEPVFFPVHKRFLLYCCFFL